MQETETLGILQTPESGSEASEASDSEGDYGADDRDHGGLGTGGARRAILRSRRRSRRVESANEGDEGRLEDMEADLF